MALSRWTTSVQILQECVQKVYSFQRMKKVYRKCTASALVDTHCVHTYTNGNGKEEKAGPPSESIETVVMNHARCRKCFASWGHLTERIESAISGHECQRLDFLKTNKSSDEKTLYKVWQTFF